MNKKFLAVAAVLCVSAGVTLTACNTQPEIPAHEHEYSTEWSYEDENHFHKCKCGDKQDITAHSFTESVVTEASCFKKGSKKLTCECGYEKTEDIPTLEHTFGKDYQSNSLQHWHECTVEGCEAEDTKVNHAWDEGEVTPPTLGEDGYTTFTCICGETKTEEGEHATGLATSFKLTDENGEEVTKVYSVLNKTVSVNVTEVQPAAADIALYDDIKIYHNGVEVSTPDKADSTIVLTAFYNTEDKVITIRCNAIAEYELTVKTRLVTKTITVSPTAPEKMAVSINAYNAETDAYVWGNASAVTVFTGQKLEFKSVVGEGLDGKFTAVVTSDNAQLANVSVNGEKGGFSASQAGGYALEIRSAYSDATAKIQVTVVDAPAASVLLNGTYNGGNYTLTFVDGANFTLEKEGESAAFTYTFEDGVFTAESSGQTEISVKLNPLYNFVVVDGGANTVLEKVVESDPVPAILGGTVWTFEYNQSTSSKDVFTLSFSNDGTGALQKQTVMIKLNRVMTDITMHFTYSAQQTGEGAYKLNFVHTPELDDDTTKAKILNMKNAGNVVDGVCDCSIINTNTLTVEGGAASGFAANIGKPVSGTTDFDVVSAEFTVKLC